MPGACLSSVGVNMPHEGSEKPSVVLVVEDEPLVRLCAVRMIEEAGFEVLEAATADDAIRTLESRNDVRVVFTDVQMPGSMDGIKLAQAVRRRWPPVKLIVTSGLGKVKLTDIPEGGRFFSKPYDPLQVRDALRELTL